MKLTSDPKRIEAAHYKLQRLEDDVVGCMPPLHGVSTVEEAERIFGNRLDRIWVDVWMVIRDLNETYDGKPLPKVAPHTRRSSVEFKNLDKVLVWFGQFAAKGTVVRVSERTGNVTVCLDEGILVYKEGDTVCVPAYEVSLDDSRT